MSKVRFITIEHLLEMKENREDFHLVEVLLEDQYNMGHIPGAINISTDRLRDEAGDHFNKDDTIVTYCLNYRCRASTTAAKILLQMGYGKVLDYKAGKQGWIDAGFELEK